MRKPVVDLFDEMTAQSRSDMALLAGVVVQRDRLLKAIEQIRALEVSYPCGYASGGTVDVDDLNNILEGL
ncbi:MAG TPA: hypothetical protein PLB92_00650 [Rhodoglobus sp.]|nr:hypothetical protein [Rhodoglobus sp.]